MLRVKKIDKSFSGTKVLEGIDLSVEVGDVVGLLGPNGAGKTTTMRVISGFLKAESGEIMVDGKKTDRGVEYKRKIGYLPEGNPLYEQMTVLEYLQLIAELREVKKEKRKEEVLKRVNECGLFEVGLKRIETLSKGFKQRVGLAASLLGNPKILMLDEPTSGLDPKQIVEIRKLIKKLAPKKAVLISSHILSEIQQLCDRVVIIQKGKVIWSGKIKDLGKGKDKILILRIKKPKQDEKIEKIEGVKIKVEKEGKEWRVILTAKGKRSDLSKKALELATKMNWSVLEMKEEGGSLESEFLKLVEGKKK
jgi:ABC-2 type transport system ATP-binding protein